MPIHSADHRGADHAALLFLFGLLPFVSPFTFWWASVATLWYLPYLLWLTLIALIAWTAQRPPNDL